MSNTENERQYNLVDMLLSAHAALRDRYHRRALILNCALLGASVLLTSCVWISDDVLQSLRLTQTEAKIVIGLASIILLILSVLEFRVNWASLSAQHDNAVRLLADLKARYREAHSLGTAGGRETRYQFAQETVTSPGEGDGGLSNQYSLTMKVIPPIPERLFAKLKAHHHFKKALSKAISDHPETPIIITKTQLRLRGIRAAIGKKDHAQGQDKTN